MPLPFIFFRIFRIDVIKLKRDKEIAMKIVKVSNKIEGKYYVYLWDGIKREVISPDYDPYQGGTKYHNTQRDEAITFVGRPYSNRNSALRYASRLRSGK